MSTTITLRAADVSDYQDLIALETRSFKGDRFSQRQFRYLLSRANAVNLVAVDANAEILGYATLLLRKNSAKGRIYSLGVDPNARGSGLGRRLLMAIEERARENHCDVVYLEVRADNRIAMKLYRSLGYVAYRWLDDYYDDGCAAWKMDKSLVSLSTDKE